MDKKENILTTSSNVPFKKSEPSRWDWINKHQRENLWKLRTSRRLLARFALFNIPFGNCVLFVFQKKQKSVTSIRKLWQKSSVFFAAFFCLSLFCVIRWCFIWFKSSYQFRRKLHAIKLRVRMYAKISCSLTWKKGVWVWFNYYSHFRSLSLSFLHGKKPHWNFISAMTFNHRRPSHTPTTKTDLSQLRAKLAGWRAKGYKNFQILRLDCFLVVVFIMIVMMLVCLYGRISREISQSERAGVVSDGKVEQTFLIIAFIYFFYLQNFKLSESLLTKQTQAERGKKYQKFNRLHLHLKYWLSICTY